MIGSETVLRARGRIRDCACHIHRLEDDLDNIIGVVEALTSFPVSSHTAHAGPAYPARLIDKGLPDVYEESEGRRVMREAALQNVPTVRMNEDDD